MLDINSKLSDFKKIGIIGLGISGISVCKFLKKNNIPFVAYDDNENAKLKYLKEFSDNNFIHYSNWNDISHVIMSPGIPLKGDRAHPIVSISKEKGCKLISDFEILYKIRKDEAKFIAVTGTNGKSTVSSMIQHILKENGLKSSLGGNIGVPTVELDFTSEVYVLELSSFQLELTDNFKADIAIILNISEDHLDRHLTMKNYVEAKQNIYKNQNDDDFLILGIDSSELMDIYKNLPESKDKIAFSYNNKPYSEVYIENNKLIYNSKEYTLNDEILTFPKPKLLNFIAAFIATAKMGLEHNKIISSITTFKDLKHRMQYLGKIENASIYNDSKATNAESVLPSLTSMKNIYWIAGGRQKSNAIKPLLDHFQNIISAYFIGEAKDDFAYSAFGKIKNIHICSNLHSAFEEAVKDALKTAEDSNIIFSPACSSFDMYKNFEERGDDFINSFNILKSIYGK